MKKIMCSMVLCFSILICSSNIYAKDNTEPDVMKDRTVVATDCVKENFEDIIDVLMTDDIFVSRITDRDALDIGKPYIVYSTNTSNQEEIYYYPIVDENTNNVVYLIEAIGVNGTYSCNALDHMIEVLNEIDYVDEDCIVYCIGNELYFENSSKTINASLYYNGDCGEICEYTSTDCDSFLELPFKEKEKMVSERLQNLTESELYEWRAEEEKMRAKLYGSLTLTNPQGQYVYNICWASAVATVYNYLTDSVVSGVEVCTRMGISLNLGGTVYDEQDALALYNINYSKIRKEPLSWSELKENIDGGKPAIANGFNSTGTGHAVTICGYTGSSSTSGYVTIWNSYLNDGQGGYATFKYGKGYFTNGDGCNYNWETSLSYY